MITEQIEVEIAQANKKALNILTSSNPVLIDVRPAIEVIPNMTKNTILVSGATIDWERYVGGQKDGIIGGAIHEGLASSPEEVDELIKNGQIIVKGCQEYNCVGSLAGITTASMPVVVVENKTNGNKAFCTLFEGSATDRLNYGVYNEGVRNNLLYLENEIGPLLGDIIRQSGGIELNPIMRRALHMGDELHSRNTAATLLFTREIFPHLLALDRTSERRKEIDEFLDYLLHGDYFFLRLSMAAAKSTIDSIVSVNNSTIVSSMAFSSTEFAIRVAGLGDEWFRGPLPIMESCQLFDSFSEDDIEIMGGESIVLETAGFGGFAQANAFPLQAYQGGTPEKMIENNLKMYQITVGEHPYFKIPYLQYRGVPTGIDIRKVLETGITPTLDIGIAGKGGGQIGAGSFKAPIEPFEKAYEAFMKRVN